MNATYHAIKGTFYLLILLFSMSMQPAQAQYAHTLGGAGFDEGIEVDIDAAGNAYFIGQFSDTLDFDPGSAVTDLRNLNGDVFVSSYDPAGALRFAFKISGNVASSESAGDIAVAPDGDFVVTGSQPFGFIDFDPDPIEEMVRTGVLYIAGYSATGQARFAVAPVGGENTSNGKGFAVALDDEKNVFVTGSFSTSIDFNPADTSSGVVPNAGVTDVFVASYTSTGQYRYAYGFGGASFDHGADIEVDANGNVYVAGMFAGDAFFDPQDADQDGDRELRSSQNTSDLFLASYDDAGRLRFVYTYAGTSGIDTSRKISLSVDAAGNLYMAGETHGTVAFDPEDADSDGNLRERTAEPLGSAFLASYTSDGLYRYATVFKGGASMSADVFVDEEGTSYITGNFSGDVDFDPGIEDAVLSSPRGADVFVASYDSTGTYRLAFNLPSTGLSGGQGIAVDADYNVVLTGGFNGEVDFDYEAAEDLRVSTGQNDIFMARYEAAGVVRVGVESAGGLPEAFTTAPLYPNPFSNHTTVSLALPAMQDVSIRVYDVLGREVQALHDGRLAAGNFQVSWDAAGQPAGLYFIRIENGTQTRVLRAMRVK